VSFAFLRAFLQHPADIGSVWPSSPALARQMLASAHLSAGEHVVELGAGTGPVTRLLAEHAGPVLALEPVPELAERARQAAPGVQVVEALADRLPELLAERGWDHAHAIISGLPFAAWSAQRQDAVLDAIEQVLAPGGRFVTFTYVHSRSLPAARRLAQTLEARFGPITVSPVVWACVPPAVVYRLTLRSRTPG